MKQVYLDGVFLPAEEAKVSVFDRGFLLGDGVYEVIPVYNGHCFQLAGHLKRLEQSLAGVRMANPHSSSEWQERIEALVAKNGGGDQSVYLQVTRGVAPRDHAFPIGVTPTAFAMSNPLVPVPEKYKTEGIAAITLPDIRWQNCNIKAITLLPNSMLRQQAHDQGAQEAILIRDGHMTEGAASNAFIVKEGEIFTSPKNAEVLPGITRELVIELAQKANVSCYEQEISEAELRAADELWVTSSTKEILPVTLLDGVAIGTGKLGPVWHQMDALYQQYKQSVAVDE